MKTDIEKGCQETKLTLEPLVRDGRSCLACGDGEGMEEVVLVKVVFYYGGKPWQKITRESNDLMRLVERKVVKWPALSRIREAVFSVRLKGAKRARRMTIVAGVTVEDGMSEFGAPEWSWLVKRKFVEVAHVEG